MSWLRLDVVLGTHVPMLMSRSFTEAGGPLHHLYVSGPSAGHESRGDGIFASTRSGALKAAARSCIVSIGLTGSRFAYSVVDFVAPPSLYLTIGSIWDRFRAGFCGQRRESDTGVTGPLYVLQTHLCVDVGVWFPGSSLGVMHWPTLSWPPPPRGEGRNLLRWRPSQRVDALGL